MEYMKLNINNQIDIRIDKDDVNEAFRRLSLGESILSRRVLTKTIKKEQM